MSLRKFSLMVIRIKSVLCIMLVYHINMINKAQLSARFRNSFPVCSGLLIGIVAPQIAEDTKKYGLNDFVSSLISLHRTLPDIRDPW